MTVSYFEWTQNLRRERWSLDEVIARLKQKIIKAYRETRELAKKHKIDMRAAALMLSVSRVTEVMKALGIWS